MKFSIITPTYNRPESLVGAINSLVGQSYLDWELLVINDAPESSAGLVVSEFKDSRIRFFMN